MVDINIHRAAKSRFNIHDTLDMEKEATRSSRLDVRRGAAVPPPRKSSNEKIRARDLFASDRDDEPMRTVH